MFLAIINDTYAEVKLELAQQADEFRLVSYIKNRYLNLIRKLKSNNKKVTDLRAVVNMVKKYEQNNEPEKEKSRRYGHYFLH